MSMARLFDINDFHFGNNLYIDASAGTGKTYTIQQLVAKLENNLYMDSIAGLSNLKGLTRWYERYVAQESAKSRVLSVSVYGIPKYSWIYETYGMSETEDVVRTVTRFLLAANPEAQHIARISEDQFAVVDAPADETALSALIVRNSAAFYRQVEQYNSGTSKPYFLEVSSGVTHLDRNWKTVPLENLISLATGEMYLNRLREGDQDAGTSNALSSWSFRSAFRRASTTTAQG